MKIHFKQAEAFTVCRLSLMMSSEMYSEAGRSSGDLRWRSETRLLHLTVSFPLGFR